jgi:hypothetical protein
MVSQARFNTLDFQRAYILNVFKNKSSSTGALRTKKLWNYNFSVPIPPNWKRLVYICKGNTTTTRSYLHRIKYTSTDSCCVHAGREGSIKTGLRTLEREWNERIIAGEASEMTYQHWMSGPGMSEHSGWLSGMMIWDYIVSSIWLAVHNSCRQWAGSGPEIGDVGKWDCVFETNMRMCPKLSIVCSFGVNLDAWPNQQDWDRKDAIVPGKLHR